MIKGTAKTHNVELDSAGFSGWPRLTCYSCNGATLLKKPYMISRQWREEVARFANEHPSEITIAYWTQLVDNAGEVCDEQIQIKAIAQRLSDSI